MKDQGRDMGQRGDTTQERTHGRSKQSRHLRLSVGLRVPSPLPRLHRPFQPPKSPSPSPTYPPRRHHVLKPERRAPVRCHTRQLEAALAKGHLINLFFCAVSRTQPRHLLKRALWHALHRSLRSWVTRSLGCSSESGCQAETEHPDLSSSGPVMSETGGKWREVKAQIKQPRARQAHFTNPLIKVNEHLPVSEQESAAAKKKINTEALLLLFVIRVGWRPAEGGGSSSVNEEDRSTHHPVT